MPGGLSPSIPIAVVDARPAVTVSGGVANDEDRELANPGGHLVVRGVDPGGFAGHPPYLRFVPATDESGQRLGSGSLRLRHRPAESGLGLAQPFAGRLADRFGAGWAILVGTLLYVAGLLLMAQSASTFGLALSAGVLIGLGLSGTTFRWCSARSAGRCRRNSAAWPWVSRWRSVLLGQFVLLPGSQWLIGAFGWAAALVVLGLLGSAWGRCRRAVRAPVGESRRGEARPLRAILAEAFTHRGFWLLSLGFFVCGFQVVFIAVHIPAFLMDRGLSPLVGTTVLALIGLFNISGLTWPDWAAANSASRCC